MTQSPAVRFRANAGFTLVETMVAVTVTTLLMGATFMAVTQAMKLSDVARLQSGVNTSLRNSMDLVVRDLIQAGQGLSNTKRAGIPNGTGFTAIKRPVPLAASVDPATYSTFTGATSLPAVSVGNGLGFNGSDVITVLANDSRAEGLSVTAGNVAANSATFTVDNTLPPAGKGKIVTVANGGPDNIALGDLMDIRCGSGDVLMAVTGINGQVLTFGVDATNDPMGLNQFGTDPTPSIKSGSVTAVCGAGAIAPAGVSLTRVKMVSYYLFRDNATDRRYPRLIRRENGRAPSTVAFGIENFTMTYDLATTDFEFYGVLMNNSDVNVGDGACKDGATNRQCSEDWIRKINLVISGRSLDVVGANKGATNGYVSNAIFGEVAMRSLAFQDRFR
jgi:Tfp pilus assembly protein PilW